MYKYSIGPFDDFSEERIKVAPLKYNSADRFSSFESIISEHELQQYQQCDSSRRQNSFIKKQPSKERSYILIDQTENSKSSSSRRQKDIKKQQATVNSIKKHSTDYNKRSHQGKQNDQAKYNYLQKFTSELNTIKQDEKEYLKSSMCIPTAISRKLREKDDILEQNPAFLLKKNPLSQRRQQNNLLQLEQQILLTQQLRVKNALLLQENIYLKERVFSLQNQMGARFYKKKLSEQLQKVVKTKQDILELNTIRMQRRQVKEKMLEQIAKLRLRCIKMQKKLMHYKQKQNNKKRVQFIEQKYESSQNAQEISEYYARFVEVFLKMIQKFPIDLKPEWSIKKKIAVGWKIVKYYIKAAQKMGASFTQIDSEGNFD